MKKFTAKMSVSDPSTVVPPGTWLKVDTGIDEQKALVTSQDGNDLEVVFTPGWVFKFQKHCPTFFALSLSVLTWVERKLS